MFFRDRTYVRYNEVAPYADVSKDGKLVGRNDAVSTAPVIVGFDVEGYFEGPAEGKLVGTLVVGREVGDVEG